MPYYVLDLPTHSFASHLFKTLLNFSDIPDYPALSCAFEGISAPNTTPANTNPAPMMKVDVICSPAN
jgi:hypothetical protein